jgi:hypothetical protein
MNGIKTTLGSIDSELLQTVKDEMVKNPDTQQLFTGVDFPLVYFMPTQGKRKDLWSGIGLSSETQTKLSGIIDEFEKYNKHISEMQFSKERKHIREAVLDVLQNRCGIMEDKATLASLYFNLSKQRITAQTFQDLGHNITTSDLESLLK